MIKKAGFLMALAMMAVGFVHAEEAVDSGFYLGVTAGKHNADVEELSGGSAGGLMGGYRIANGFALEAAFTASDFDVEDFSGCLLEFDTAAFYGAFRSPGKGYFKARVGLLHETLTARDACAGLIDEMSDTGLSLGVGAGFRFGKGALEVEYTLVEQDVNQLSANLIYNF
ncbi:MAG: outer membrane beta-barrel protein [Moraxellaceae bacterium]